jgi:hypothetical protein
VGDPEVDQFYASVVPSLGNQESETLMREAGTALLEKIGPAVRMVHSQGGVVCLADLHSGSGVVAAGSDAQGSDRGFRAVAEVVFFCARHGDLKDCRPIPLSDVTQPRAVP